MKRGEDIKKIQDKMEEILSNISHELKTPITIILSSIELSLEEGGKKDVEQLLNLAKKSGERLKLAVENLINHAYLRKYADEIEFAEVSIEEVINNAIERAKFTLNEKNIRVVKNIEKELKVYGSKEKLELAFYNLIDNAVKFNRKNGKIGISARKVNEHVEIIIEDSGIGVEEELKERIFDEFYQVSSGMTREYPGLGLGLCVVKDIISLHLGEIKFESEKDMGSRFIITLKSHKKDVGRRKAAFVF